MSAVTSVVLITGLLDRDIVYQLSKGFSKHPSSKGHDLGEDLTYFREGGPAGAHKSTGGRKNPQLSVHAAGFNYSSEAIDQLVRAFMSAPWEDPDNAIMIVSREDSDMADVLFPKSSNR